MILVADRLLDDRLETIKDLVDAVTHYFGKCAQILHQAVGRDRADVTGESDPPSAWTPYVRNLREPNPR